MIMITKLTFKTEKLQSKCKLVFHFLDCVRFIIEVLQFYIAVVQVDKDQLGVASKLT